MIGSHTPGSGVSSCHRTGHWGSCHTSCHSCHTSCQPVSPHRSLSSHSCWSSDKGKRQNPQHFPRICLPNHNQETFHFVLWFWSFGFLDFNSILREEPPGTDADQKRRDELKLMVRISGHTFYLRFTNEKESVKLASFDIILICTQENWAWSGGNFSILDGQWQVFIMTQGCLGQSK